MQTPPAIVGLTGLGLAFTVFCSESANLTTEDAALAYATSVLPDFPERVLRVQPKQGRLFQECPAWDVPDADPSMSAPVESDVPVLILEGDLRRRHRARVGRRRHTGALELASSWRSPSPGTRSSEKSPCSLEIFNAFLNDPTKPVDADVRRRDRHPVHHRLSTVATTRPGLKRIDPAVLQALVDTTVDDELVPGTVALLRTPHGELTAAAAPTNGSSTVGPTSTRASGSRGPKCRSPRLREQAQVCLRPQSDGDQFVLCCAPR